MKPKDIRILIACEESQAVCNEFRKFGFQAYSCDLMECSGGHPDGIFKVMRLKLCVASNGIV